MKSEKPWLEESKEQIFIKDALISGKDYEFKDFFTLLQKSEECQNVKGAQINKALKNLENLGEIFRLKRGEKFIYRTTKSLVEATGIVKWQSGEFAIVFVENEAGTPTGESIYLNKKEASRVLNGEKIKVKRIPYELLEDKISNEDQGIVTGVVSTSPCYTIGENVGTVRKGWLGAIRLCEPIFTKVIRLSEKHELKNNEELNRAVKEKGMILSGYLRRTGEFDRYSSLRAFFDVKHVLGKWTDPEIETKVALEWMQADDKFTGMVLAEAHRSGNIGIKDLLADKGRRDIRNIPFVTIDGVNTKDFDDALSAQKNPDGSYKIFVAIAEVSRYVKPNTLLDKVARKRSTSLYMPHKAISMLPEVLSTGICSLNPGLERAAMVFETDIDNQGNITNNKFYPALVKSFARLTYAEVDSFIKENIVIKNLGPYKEDSRYFEPLNSTIKGILSLLVNCAEILKGNRNTINFEKSIEIIPMVGENRKAYALKLSDDKSPANKLVEEYMVLTNSASAKLLAEKGVNNVLYRNQQTPLSENGIAMPAKYENKSVGHYGLGTSHYMHFTSPIRRYPDLLAQRAIKKVLGFSYEEDLSEEDVKDIGIHCTEIQRLFRNASNKAKQWLILDYAERMKGIPEPAVIIKEIDKGWYVYGENTKIPGFVVKPQEEEILKTLIEKKFYMEIERVDYFSERIDLKAISLDCIHSMNLPNNDKEVAAVMKIRI